MRYGNNPSGLRNIDEIHSAATCQQGFFLSQKPAHALSDRIVPLCIGPDLCCTAAGMYEDSDGVMASDSMYTEFFGLSERPFTRLPDPGFLYWSKHHQRAYSVLQFGIAPRAPIPPATG
mgnify:CR=1 FL=1